MLQILFKFRRLILKYTNQFRNRFLKLGFNRIGLDCYISRNALIWGRSGISLENDVKIQSHAVIQCTEWGEFERYRSRGSIKIGRGTSIQPFAYLNSQGGSIEIGKNCSINSYSVLYGSTGGLKIGDYVRIAAQTVIVASEHNFESIDIPISSQGLKSQGIIIEDDVWIGAGVKILDGVSIAEGCVIGAGSIVTHSTESYGVYIGTPAKKIKNRSPDNL